MTDGSQDFQVGSLMFPFPADSWHSVVFRHFQGYMRAYPCLPEMNGMLLLWERQLSTGRSQLTGTKLFLLASICQSEQHSV